MTDTSEWREWVDNIQHFPAPREFSQTPQTIALGDLHASAVKLLYFLTRENFIKIRPEDYCALSLLLCEDYLKTPQALKTLENLLAQITPAKNSGTTRIVLIGDELFDRGPNDFYILKLLEKMAEIKINYSILISNHGFEFLYHFLNLNGEDFLMPDVPHAPKRQYYLASKAQAQSFFHMVNLLDKLKINKTAWIKLIKDHYLPHIRLVDSDFIAEKNQLVMYTHAPASLDIIREIAQAYHIVYADDKADALFAVIKNIQEKFAQELNTGDKLSRFKNPSDFSNVFLRLIWQRYGDGGTPRAEIKNYTLHFVHGHDANGETFSPNVTNLDNDFCKGESLNASGYYSVYVV